MVSTRPSTSKSSSPFNNHLVTVPKAAITISIIVTVMFHSFFNSIKSSRYLSFFSLSFSFILWSAETTKSTNLQGHLLLIIIIIIKILLFYSFESSSHQLQLKVFHTGLLKSPIIIIIITIIIIIIIIIINCCCPFV